MSSKPRETPAGTAAADPGKMRPDAMRASYEHGMKITYDAVSRRVVVAFRGRIFVLQDRYDTEQAGVAAGESQCRRLGWQPQDAGKARRHVRHPWRE